MTSKVILPISKPTIGMLSYESHIDGILSGNFLDKTNFYNSLFDLEAIELMKGNQRNFDFFIGRNLRGLPLKSTFFQRVSSRNLLDFIVILQKQRKYIILCIDSYFIQNYKTFKQAHIVHSPLISGIDWENKRVLLNDFFDFKFYSSAWVDFDQIVKAYANLQNVLDSENNKFSRKEKWLLNIETICEFQEKRCLNWEKEYYEYLKGSVERIKKEDSFWQINNILSNSNEKTYQISICRGMHVYNEIKTTIRSAQTSDTETIEKKAFSILNKHFKVYGYLNNSKFSEKIVKDALTMSESLLYLGIKENISKKFFKKYNQMIKLVTSLEEMEHKILKGDN